MLKKTTVNPYLCLTANQVIVPRFGGGRKVRTAQGGTPVNGRSRYSVKTVPQKIVS